MGANADKRLAIVARAALLCHNRLPYRVLGPPFTMTATVQSSMHPGNFEITPADHSPPLLCNLLDGLCWVYDAINLHRCSKSRLDSCMTNKY